MYKKAIPQNNDVLKVSDTKDPKKYLPPHNFFATLKAKFLNHCLRGNKEILPALSTFGPDIASDDFYDGRSREGFIKDIKVGSVRLGIPRKTRPAVDEFSLL